MMGMTLAMSSLGLASRKRSPISSWGLTKSEQNNSVAHQKDHGKVKLANSHRQLKNRNHKRVAKQTASDQQTVTLARK